MSSSGSSKPPASHPPPVAAAAAPQAHPTRTPRLGRDGRPAWNAALLPPPPPHHPPRPLARHSLMSAQSRGGRRSGTPSGGRASMGKITSYFKPTPPRGGGGGDGDRAGNASLTGTPPLARGKGGGSLAADGRRLRWTKGLRHALELGNGTKLTRTRTIPRVGQSPPTTPRTPVLRQDPGSWEGHRAPQPPLGRAQSLDSAAAGASPCPPLPRRAWLPPRLPCARI